MLKDIHPDCDSCFHGYAGRCGGYTTASRAALEQELRGEHEGIGCRGDPGPIITFIYCEKHPDGEFPVIPKLPAFVPQIITSGLDLIPRYPSGLNTFAVSFTTLFSRHGKLKWTDRSDLREGLRLPLDSRLLVVGSGDDPQLEKIWYRTITDDTWSKLAALDLIASTGFSFSVWDVQSRMDQIINEDRNMLTCRYLLASGIPAIPVVFWYDKYDFEYLVRWLQEHRIGTVAVMPRFLRSYQRFERLCEEMRYLQEQVGTALHFVVIGTSLPRRISRLLSEFSCSIVTAQPFSVAVRSGGRITPSLERERSPDVTRSQEELVTVNVGNFWDFCNQSIGQLSPTPIQLTLLNPFAGRGCRTTDLVRTI